MKSKIIQLIGFTGVLLGWIIAGFEVYHNEIKSHQFEAMPWAFSGLFMTCGALMIQTGNVMKVVDFIISIRKPGGKRFYDKTDESPIRPTDN